MSLFLPNDVWLVVGDFIEDQKDRLNLVFSCRQFHDLFLGSLYRSATLDGWTKTRSFLGAILRRPGLARAVRELDFHSWKPMSLSDDRNPGNYDMAMFADLAKVFSHSEGEYQQWKHDLKNGAGDAWIALLLPLLSNLEHLHLVYPKRSGYLDETLRRAMNGDKPFNAQPAFRRLAEVSLNHMDEGDDSGPGNYLPSQILPFFRFPSMRVFSADSVIEHHPQTDDRKAVSEPLNGSSSIDEIRLSSSNGRQGMGSLVTSCSSLRSFKYQHSDSHALAEGYQPSAFYQSLAGSKNSLETLWLDYYGQHHTFTASGLNESHDEWFGSLVDFTALKDIRIRLPNLLDIRYQNEPTSPLTEVLPSSLESLYVEGCKENNLSILLSQLELVIKDRKTRFPSLARLDVEGFFHDEEDYEDSGYDENSSGEKFIKPRIYESTEALRSTCEKAGIEFYIRDRVVAESMKGSPA
ncbi:hypothetical protein PHISCL_00005 [Aspergillus sclerotialis]|uniref:Leucine-rich repeat domain-containing protein n=1 Tax=Aspergillus sclerotialis TaxID=2070753 RepID=A0A3A2ZXX5_9EURO|nr:hypothetical protein PHISCL_00005 [Aspergillus sclerotialis]